MGRRKPIIYMTSRKFNIKLFEFGNITHVELLIFTILRVCKALKEHMKSILKDALHWTDFAIWCCTIGFFCISAVMLGGNISNAFIGGAGVVVAMFFIGASIEAIIATLQDVKGIGTIIGFLTNGPEALVLAVGLLNDDILFASSTPLGSNTMNVLLLMLAAIVTWKSRDIFSHRPMFVWGSFMVTAALASSFFLFEVEHQYYLWLALIIPVSVLIFKFRPEESVVEGGVDSLNKAWLIPSVFVLIFTGYVLDDVVNYAAEAANVSTGLIGFFVLATLTSWPEFKSCMTLLKRDRPVSAIVNIIVSNVSNLWLAAFGVSLYLFLNW